MMFTVKLVKELVLESGYQYSATVKSSGDQHGGYVPDHMKYHVFSKNDGKNAEVFQFPCLEPIIRLQRSSFRISLSIKCS